MNLSFDLKDSTEAATIAGLVEVFLLGYRFNKDKRSPHYIHMFLLCMSEFVESVEWDLDYTADDIRRTGDYHEIACIAKSLSEISEKLYDCIPDLDREAIREKFTRNA